VRRNDWSIGHPLDRQTLWYFKIPSSQVRDIFSPLYQGNIMHTLLVALSRHTPQQPVSNATMEQVKRWGEDVSNDGLDAFYAH